MGTDCSKGGEDFARGRERRDATPSQEADEVPLEISPEQHAALIANLKFAEIPIESFATVLHFQDAWDILRHFHTDPFKDHRWAFRGQANAAWKLEPSIERLKRAHSKRFRAGAEEYVRRAFKQRAHQYMQYLPAEKEELEWMALMRHHGAPTRFLDWTTSPYVAAFFAVAEAGEDVESAILGHRHRRDQEGGHPLAEPRRRDRRAGGKQILVQRTQRLRSRVFARDKSRHCGPSPNSADE